MTDILVKKRNREPRKNSTPKAPSAVGDSYWLKFMDTDFQAAPGDFVGVCDMDVINEFWGWYGLYDLWELIREKEIHAQDIHGFVVAEAPTFYRQSHEKGAFRPETPVSMVHVLICGEIIKLPACILRDLHKEKDAEV